MAQLSGYGDLDLWVSVYSFATSFFLEYNGQHGSSHTFKKKTFCFKNTATPL